MANITIAVGTQPFMKTSERPTSVVAGEALGMIVPVYKKDEGSGVFKHYKADSDTTDTEKNTVAGITVTISETDSYVSVVKRQGTIVDWGSALTKGTEYFLTGLGTIGEYSDVSNGDALVRVGQCDDNQDFVVDIYHYGTTKSA